MSLCFVISRFAMVYTQQYLQKTTKRGKKIAILGLTQLQKDLQHIFKKRKVIMF
jgi:hypothetical protein